MTLDGSLMRQDHFEGAKYVCSPPLRDNDADREKIWEALSNGTFTIVSSDHAPTNFYDEHGKRVALHGEGDETGDFRCETHAARVSQWADTISPGTSRTVCRASKSECL